MANGLTVGASGEEVVEFNLETGEDRSVNACELDEVRRGHTVATGTPMTVVGLVIDDENMGPEMGVLKTETMPLEETTGKSLSEKRELTDCGTPDAGVLEVVDVRAALLLVMVIAVLFIIILTTDAIIWDKTEIPGTPELDLEEDLETVVGRSLERLVVFVRDVLEILRNVVGTLVGALVGRLSLGRPVGRPDTLVVLLGRLDRGKLMALGDDLDRVDTLAEPLRMLLRAVIGRSPESIVSVSKFEVCSLGVDAGIGDMRVMRSSSLLDLVEKFPNP